MDHTVHGVAKSQTLLESRTEQLLNQIKSFQMFAVVNNTMIHIEIHMCTTFAFLEKEMTTHSSILAWRNPWTEEPGGLQSMG